MNHSSNVPGGSPAAPARRGLRTSGPSLAPRTLRGHAPRRGLRRLDLAPSRPPGPQRRSRCRSGARSASAPAALPRPRSRISRASTSTGRSARTTIGRAGMKFEQPRVRPRRLEHLLGEPKPPRGGYRDRRGNAEPQQAQCSNCQTRFARRGHCDTTPLFGFIRRSRPNERARKPSRRCRAKTTNVAAECPPSDMSGSEIAASSISRDIKVTRPPKTEPFMSEWLNCWARWGTQTGYLRGRRGDLVQ